MPQEKHPNEGTESGAANPDRTVLDEEGVAHSATEGHPRGDPHEQDWESVRKEVREAIRDAPGPDQR